MDDRASGIVETIYQQLGGKGFAMMIGMNFPILVSEDKKTGISFGPQPHRHPPSQA